MWTAHARETLLAPLARSLSLSHSLSLSLSPVLPHLSLSFFSVNDARSSYFFACESVWSVCVHFFSCSSCSYPRILTSPPLSIKLTLYITFRNATITLNPKPTSNSFSSECFNQPVASQTISMFSWKNIKQFHLEAVTCSFKSDFKCLSDGSISRKKLAFERNVQRELKKKFLLLKLI